METQLTPQTARGILEKRLDKMPDFWITTELLGSTKKKRAAHEAEQQARSLEQKLRKQKIRDAIELSDEDLQWLLENGWSPHDY